MAARLSMASRIEQAFGLIEAAAVAGARCPQNEPHGPIASGAVTALVEAGRVKSEIYAHNWRVVTILAGPNRGQTTAPPPLGGSPYLVNGVHVDRLRRRQEARACPRPDRGSATRVSLASPSTSSGPTGKGDRE